MVLKHAPRVPPCFKTASQVQPWPRQPWLWYRTRAGTDANKTLTKRYIFRGSVRPRRAPHLTVFWEIERDVVVELVDFEDSDNEEIIKEFENEVEGYPTIILTKDGKNHHYKGDRESASSYMNYLTEMLS